VQVRKEGSSYSYELTEKGSREAAYVSLLKEVRTPKKWDGKWRIVIFDVWERRRLTRDRLRALLIETGFVRLQNSVWVYPYPCEELIVYIRTELRVGKGLEYIVAEGIERDKELRRRFKLPYSLRS
jgi:phenylacetic acid degradation operon negative regulatory protein